MSSIHLQAFSLFRRPQPMTQAADIEILCGASDAQLTPRGIEMSWYSVPLHSTAIAAHAPQPGHGQLLLYGLRDTTLEMRRMHAEARRLGVEVAWADIEVDVGDLEPGLVDRSVLRKAGASMRFVSVRRMRESLQLEILDRFGKYATSAGENIDGELTRIRQISTRPDLWDRLFEDDKDFRHIDVLAIPVADDPDLPHNIRFLAYVRPGVTITSVTSSDAATLLPPAWLTAPRPERWLGAPEVRA